MTYTLQDVTNSKQNGLVEYSEEIRNAYKDLNRPSNMFVMEDKKSNKLFAIYDNDGNFIGLTAFSAFINDRFKNSVMFYCAFSDVNLFKIALPLLETYMANEYKVSKAMPGFIPLKDAVLKTMGYKFFAGRSYKKIAA